MHLQLYSETIPPLQITDDYSQAYPEPPAEAPLSSTINRSIEYIDPYTGDILARNTAIMSDDIKYKQESFDASFNLAQLLRTDNSSDSFFVSNCLAIRLDFSIDFVYQYELYADKDHWRFDYYWLREYGPLGDLIAILSADIRGNEEVGWDEWPDTLHGTIDPGQYHLALASVIQFENYSPSDSSCYGRHYTASFKPIPEPTTTPF